MGKVLSCSMNAILRRTAAMLFILTLFCSCGSSKEAASGPTARTTVEVRNRNGIGVEIYVMDGERRIRLGRVGGGRTETFDLPAYLISSATPLRFLMESAAPSPAVLSETITVLPGEQVILVVPEIR